MSYGIAKFKNHDFKKKLVQTLYFQLSTYEKLQYDIFSRLTGHIKKILGTSR